MTIPPSAPPQTADSIRATLERDHTTWVTRAGVRYLISEDEDANGVFAWPDADETTPAVASFGESEWDQDTGDIDYRAVSHAIMAWINEVSA